MINVSVRSLKRYNKIRNIIIKDLDLIKISVKRDYANSLININIININFRL